MNHALGHAYFYLCDDDVSDHAVYHKDLIKPPGANLSETTLQMGAYSRGAHSMGVY